MKLVLDLAYRLVVLAEEGMCGTVITCLTIWESAILNEPEHRRTKEHK